MNEVSLKPVIDELETLFSKFNKAFFEGKLEKPVITVSPDHTRGAYGWCTAWKAWQDGTKDWKAVHFKDRTILRSDRNLYPEADWWALVSTVDVEPMKEPGHFKVVSQ